MRQIITDEYGQVKIGDTLLPGIFQKLEIDGEVRIDNMEVPGSSGSSKQPQGFNDAEIYLEILLPTDEESTCYDKLKIIVNTFKKVDKSAKPFVYRIVNQHTQVWGIKEVVFLRCATTEDNKTDSVKAVLEFREFKPVIVKLESAVAGAFTDIPSNQFESFKKIANKLGGERLVFSPMGVPITIGKSPIKDTE